MDTILALYIAIFVIVPLIVLAQECCEQQNLMIDWLGEISKGQLGLLALIFLPITALYLTYLTVKLFTWDFWNLLGKIGKKK